jgi:hypothetical protein
VPAETDTKIVYRLPDDTSTIFPLLLLLLSVVVRPIWSLRRFPHPLHLGLLQLQRLMARAGACRFGVQFRVVFHSSCGF